jgi:probable rRNA maturation factor
LSINIYYDNTTFRVRNWRKVVRVLNEVIRKEKKVPGDLSYIVTTDDEVRRINIQFLEHDYNTDVITFNYNNDKIINGEIYISIDTVKENALNYNVSLKNEIQRVILHGLLHLVGFNDKSEEEKLDMKRQEDFWLDFLEKGKDGLSV